MGFCCNERKLPSLGSQGALLLRVRLRFIEVLVGACCSIAGYGVWIFFFSDNMIRVVQIVLRNCIIV